MPKAVAVVPLAFVVAGCSPLRYPLHLQPLTIPGRVHQARPSSPSLPIGRWDEVMRVPPRSIVDVLTADGVPKVGAVVAADAHQVTVHVGGIDVRVGRAEVIRVDLVDNAGSEVGAIARSAARGALLGVGAAALVGAVVGAEIWPPPGALLRTGAAAGAVSGGHAALARRQGRMIYLAPGYMAAGHVRP
jgi:hypothetical protein